MPRLVVRPGLAGVLLPALASVAAAQSVPAPPFDPAHLDTTCSPCVDFYRWANGGWQDAHPVPDDRSSWTAYAEAEERVRRELGRMLDEMARTWRDAAAGGGDRELGAFFACCMDSARAEREGAEPLRPLLARIEGVRDVAALSATLGFLHALGVGVPFSVGATPDPSDADRTVGELDRGALTLPVASWYSEEGEDFEDLRTSYAALVERAFLLLGRDADTARGDAASVVRLETALAGASLSRTERRDPSVTTNLRTRAEVRSLLPSLAWDAYWEALGVPEPETFNVPDPAYLGEVDRLLAAEPPAVWRSYLSWWLVRRSSRFLDRELAAIDFELRELWTGAAAPPPRRRMCEEMADFALGDVLGRRWAERAFPASAKRTAEEMAENIVATLRERIEALPWMAPPTRREALAKLDSLEIRIGYPEESADRAGPEIDPDASLLSMVASVSAWRTRRDLTRIGRPPDTAWSLLPQDVGAGYLPQRNVIEFPAAKFQPPFFDPGYPEEMNYGAIGATIAHEVTHALDDEGRKYDARGSVRDWWTPEDAARFEAEAARLAGQFDGYTVLDGLPVDGRLTLGENIADLGGVTLAYHAWMRSRRSPAPDVRGGFTAEQRFFLAWARNFRQTIRPERLRRDLERDVHAPTYWRINGSLRNLAEFAEAFGCGEGDPMVSPDSLRVRIW